MAAGGEPDDDLSLASSKEEALIEELRGMLKVELGELRERGCDFLHTTGDVFLLRVLRGNSHDLGQSCQWYQRFLAVRKEHGLDDIHRKGQELKLPWRAESMPNYPTVSPMMNTSFDETKLQLPSGHLIWYDAVGDMNAQEVVANQEVIVEFLCWLLEGRLELMDRLSREQGKLVKTVRILDLEAYTFNRDMLRFSREVLSPLVINTSPEAARRIYLINTPWFAEKIYLFLKAILPPRVAMRLRCIGRQFLQDNELLQDVGPAVLAQLVATRRCNADDSSALQGLSRFIRPGQVMERMIEVTEGQRVSWEFSLGTVTAEEEAELQLKGVMNGVMNSFTGKVTDVSFSVGFMSPDAFSEDGSQLPEEQVLASPQKLAAAAEASVGSVLAPSAGVVILRWSNKSSWVRAKVVRQYKITVDGK